MGLAVRVSGGSGRAGVRARLGVGRLACEELRSSRWRREEPVNWSEVIRSRVGLGPKTARDFVTQTGVNYPITIKGHQNLLVCSHHHKTLQVILGHGTSQSFFDKFQG